MSQSDRMNKFAVDNASTLNQNSFGARMMLQNGLTSAFIGNVTQTQRPLQARSAINLFFENHKESIMQSLVETKKVERNSSQKETDVTCSPKTCTIPNENKQIDLLKLTMLVNERWNEASESTRAFYHAEASKDLQRYKSELLEYYYMGSDSVNRSELREVINYSEDPYTCNIDNRRQCERRPHTLDNQNQEMDEFVGNDRKPAGIDNRRQCEPRPHTVDNQNQAMDEFVGNDRKPAGRQEDQDDNGGINKDGDSHEQVEDVAGNTEKLEEEDKDFEEVDDLDVRPNTKKRKFELPDESSCYGVYIPTHTVLPLFNNNPSWKQPLWHWREGLLGSI